MLRTGVVTNNNISVETKFDKGDFRISLSEMHQKGVFENTKLNSYTVNMSGGIQFSKNCVLMPILIIIRLIHQTSHLWDMVGTVLFTL